MVLMVMMMLLHFDMVIQMNMVVDKHLYLVLVIVDSSSQHFQLDTVNIEEHIEVHYHYLMFCYTCHL